MLAGATGIDHVMLVVAADDGPMPQTREHLAILDLSGLSSGVVALTKADLVPATRLAEVSAEVRALLAPTALADAPLLAVSSVTGQGIDALADHLVRAGAALPATRERGRFRLVVDRCFSLAGIGTVVTGTALSGAVAVRDNALVSPSADPAAGRDSIGRRTCCACHRQGARRKRPGAGAAMQEPDRQRLAAGGAAGQSLRCCWPAARRQAAGKLPRPAGDGASWFAATGDRPCCRR